MSVEFANAYQEILLDNLMSVIKQNFIFQTQIKLSENVGNEKVQLEKQVQDLVEKLNSMQVNNEQLEFYKNISEQNSSAHEEKSRIQSALNDEMKKSSNFEKELRELREKFDNAIKQKENEIVELNKTIGNLKTLVAPTKLKKVSVVSSEEPKVQKFIKPVDLEPIKVSDPGTF